MTVIGTQEDFDFKTSLGSGVRRFCFKNQKERKVVGHLNINEMVV